jgi:hypothetical protein
MMQNFDSGLALSSLGAAATKYANALKAIQTTWDTLGNDPGKSGEMYDVILQAGHYKREYGAMGTRGKDVTEQQLAAYVVKGIAEDLRKSGNMKVLVLSADEYNPNLRSKLFLAIHADGSAQPCSTGPSLSYQKDSSALAMHAIGWGLSQALGYAYENFRKDRYTADAANYYMFSRVDAPVMKGVLEVGELTCRPSEVRLIMAADGIAANVARAITFVLDSTQPSTATKK